jgi:hypothetical protein
MMAFGREGVEGEALDQNPDEHALPSYPSSASAHLPDGSFSL